MTDSVIIQSTTVDNLMVKIENLIDEKFAKHLNPEPQKIKEKEFLTRKEICSLLRISLSSLHIYTKEGILQSYQIGGRILYKAEEVENSLTTIQSRKYKHRGGL